MKGGCSNEFCRGRLAQLGERGVRNAEAEGSNPLPSISPPSHEENRQLAKPHDRRRRKGEICSRHFVTAVPLWFPGWPFQYGSDPKLPLPGRQGFCGPESNRWFWAATRRQ